jgi:predicted signal transduction protein with EAL and GGDEF domain
MSLMDANELSDDIDRLLAALAALPVEELRIVESFVNELLERPDDNNEHRRTAVGAAIARMSALRSV